MVKGHPSRDLAQAVDQAVGELGLAGEAKVLLKIATVLDELPRDRALAVMVAVCALNGFFEHARRFLDTAEAEHNARDAAPG